MKSRINNSTFCLLVLMISTILASCAVKDGAPISYNRDWRTIEDAVPQNEPFSRYGNPESYIVFGQQYKVMPNNTGFSEKGFASWYGTKFHGQRTSSGETYDMYAMTAAHKSLRIPSYVEVTNLNNNRKAIVKVNDRGPFHDGRVIDLSYAAATKLGVAETGTAPVTIRVVGEKRIETIPVKNVLTDTVIGDTAIDPPIESSIEKLVGDQFYVQVAAFSSEENARNMLNDLIDKKFLSVRVHVDTVNDKFLFRVRIGPVPTKFIAEKLVLQLKEINHNNVKIIARN